MCQVKQYIHDKQRARHALDNTASWLDVLTVGFLQGPVKVQGPEQYMRTKQHARQLEQEQRERERKAFILEPRKQLDACTIPKPFALQTELREVWIQPAAPSLLRFTSMLSRPHHTVAVLILACAACYACAPSYGSLEIPRCTSPTACLLLRAAHALRYVSEQRR